MLGFIANLTGINITYDRDVVDGRAISVQLDGVTLEQALNQIMTIEQLSYKVVNRAIHLRVSGHDRPSTRSTTSRSSARSISRTPIRPSLSQTVSQLIRIAGIAVQPMIAPNKTANTITVRATAPMMQIVEKIIEQNDKPRAEIIVDVEILEVDRTRTKSYGLNLSRVRRRRRSSRP